MSLKYTRKLIEEAIKYWTSKLHLMTESINNTIDALISEFGENRVKSTIPNYILTKEDLKKIYNILNTNFFNNELSPILLELWPEKFIIDKLNNNALESGVVGDKLLNAKCYGVFSGVCKDVLDKNNNIINVNITKEIIMINLTYLQKCVFIFVVAVICHEMIHYLDRFSDEFLSKQLKASLTNTEFDSHQDKIFIDMMKEANSIGINVVQSFKDLSHETANQLALYTLKKVLNETDDQTHINKTDHSVIMRNNGSHSFFFAEFD